MFFLFAKVVGVKSSINSTIIVLNIVVHYESFLCVFIRVEMLQQRKNDVDAKERRRDSRKNALNIPRNNNTENIATSDSQGCNWKWSRVSVIFALFKVMNSFPFWSKQWAKQRILFIDMDPWNTLPKEKWQMHRVNDDHWELWEKNCDVWRRISQNTNKASNEEERKRMWIEVSEYSISCSDSHFSGSISKKK